MIDNNKIEIFSSNNPFLFDEINDENIGVSFDKESASTGDIVCVTDLYDELIRRFGSYKNAKLIYEFAKSSIVDCNYAKNYPITSAPYLDFTIYLEQTIIDEGLLSPYAEKWIPGKKYYVGDVVYYSIDGSDENIKTYILVNGDSSETFEIPFSIYQANSWDTIHYSSRDGKYYAKFWYYRGYYDERTRLTYFDSIDIDGTMILDHWEEKITTNVSGDRDYSGITGTTESLLKNVMRRRSDMDYSGNTLPFILHYYYEIEHGVKKRKLDTSSTETFYMCGSMNMDYNFNSSNVVADVLESVTFYSSDSVPESGVSFTEVDKPIVITLNKEAYTDSGNPISISDYDMVQFVYYSSATLIRRQNNWVRKENTGVKYIEKRPLIVQTSVFDIENDNNHSALTMTYIDVNPNTQYESNDDNIDIINSMRSDVNYSDIIVNKSQLDGDYFLNVQTFKDETMMGVQNIKKEINVDIERGMAESFQKHNMLGEICTLQDLENYKNGRYLE